MQYSQKLCENIAIKVVNIICQKCIILGLKRACKHIQYKGSQLLYCMLIYFLITILNKEFLCYVQQLEYLYRVYENSQICQLFNQIPFKNWEFTQKPGVETLSFISIIVDDFMKTWKFMYPFWDCAVAVEYLCNKGKVHIYVQRIFCTIWVERSIGQVIAPSEANFLFNATLPV